jgi:hypothetical protein
MTTSSRSSGTASVPWPVATGRAGAVGQDLAAYQERYPELAVLSRLPGDTVLDGEVVLLPQGCPTLDALLARHQHRPTRGPSARAGLSGHLRRL